MDVLDSPHLFTTTGAISFDRNAVLGFAVKATGCVHALVRNVHGLKATMLE